MLIRGLGIRTQQGEARKCGVKKSNHTQLRRCEGREARCERGDVAASTMAIDDAKYAKSLLKKLRQIEELKALRRLDAAQRQKLQGESALRAKLAELGVDAPPPSTPALSPRELRDRIGAATSAAEVLDVVATAPSSLDGPTATHALYWLARCCASERSATREKAAALDAAALAQLVSRLEQTATGLGAREVSKAASALGKLLQRAGADAEAPSLRRAGGRHRLLRARRDGARRAGGGDRAPRARERRLRAGRGVAARAAAAPPRSRRTATSTRRIGQHAVGLRQARRASRQRAGGGAGVAPRRRRGGRDEAV